MKWQTAENRAFGQSARVAALAVQAAESALPDTAPAEAIAILAAGIIPHLQSRIDVWAKIREEENDEPVTQRGPMTDAELLARGRP